MKFHFHVDPDVLQSVGLDPDEDVIITSIHEFKDLCTIVQNHVAAIIPITSVYRHLSIVEAKEERDAALREGAGPVPGDPYQVPALPHEEGDGPSPSSWTSGGPS